MKAAGCIFFRKFLSRWNPFPYPVSGAQTVLSMLDRTAGASHSSLSWKQHSATLGTWGLYLLEWWQKQQMMIDSTGDQETIARSPWERIPCACSVCGHRDSGCTAKSFPCQGLTWGGSTSDVPWGMAAGCCKEKRGLLPTVFSISGKLSDWPATCEEADQTLQLLWGGRAYGVLRVRQWLRRKAHKIQAPQWQSQALPPCRVLPGREEPTHLWVGTASA